MTRAKTAAGLAVKVFVKQNQIAPVRVGRVLLDFAVTGTHPFLVRQEGAGEPARDFLRHFFQVHHLPGADRAFHLKTVAEEEMITLERFHDEEVNREPNRSAPVRVATEEIARALAWHVIDAMFFVADMKDVGMIAMVA